MNLTSLHPLLIEFATFVAVASGVVLLTLCVRRLDPRVRSRLRVMNETDARNMLPKMGSLSALERALLKPLPERIASYLVPDSEAARLRVKNKLMQAGIYSNHGLIIFFTMRVLLLVAPVLLALAVIKLTGCPYVNGISVGIVCSGIGALLPTLWLHRKIAQRHSQLRRSLPDFLDLVVACVESGLALQMAITRVAEELRQPHPILAEEISLSLTQIEFGRTLSVAVQDLAQRTALEELRLFSSFIQQAQRWGAGTANAMRELADMLRTQREQRAEERAQKAAVKIMIPTLLFIFPAVFVVLAGPAAIRIHEAFSQQSNYSLHSSH